MPFVNMFEWITRLPKPFLYPVFDPQNRHDHLSAFDEEVVRAVHSALLTQERLVIAPTDIVDLMDAALFKVGLAAIQKAAAVGRAIRRLNLGAGHALQAPRPLCL